MTFEMWLRKQKKRNDPVGDLACDYIDSKTKDKLTPEYLFKNNACSGAFDALDRAYLEYLREISKNLLSMLIKLKNSDFELSDDYRNVLENLSEKIKQFNEALKLAKEEENY